MSYLKQYARLVRLDQWVKNLFIFIPVFFSAQLPKVWESNSIIFTFLSFSLAASAIYIFNDLHDVKSDRLHPVKKFRPIAAGVVKEPIALFIGSSLMAISLLIAYFILINAFIIIAGYIVLNLLYTYKLKEFAIVDIVIISLGFLLRIFAGGIAADVRVSKWLVLMIFLLSLTLALGKRRDDLMINPDSKQTLRASLDGYSVEFINSAIILLSVISIMSYILYTVSDEVIARFQSDYIYLTSFPVIIAFIRYLQLTFVYQKTGSPTSIFLKDNFIRSMILIWISLFSFFIYGIHKT